VLYLSMVQYVKFSAALVSASTFMSRVTKKKKQIVNGVERNYSLTCLDFSACYFE
jgi:hypothetical protein